MKRPHFALPEIYDDSLSYYDVLRKLIKSMHVISDNLNKIPEQIENEAKAREQEDGTLQTNIDNEAMARQEADNELRELISTSGGGGGVTEAQLNEEVTARQQGDAVLDGKISELKGDLKDKIGWAKVTGSTLYLYADKAMTNLIQTVTLPSSGSGGGSADGNTTYTFAISGNVITVTDSDGGRQTITLPSAVTDSHINSLIDAKLGVIENGTY